jgi:hypothetical protein
MHFWCRDFMASCGSESLQRKELAGNGMGRIWLKRRGANFN